MSRTHGATCAGYGGNLAVGLADRPARAAEVRARHTTGFPLFSVTRGDRAGLVGPCAVRQCVLEQETHDLAPCTHELAEAHYREAETMRVVLYNLSAHKPAAPEVRDAETQHTP